MWITVFMRDIIHKTMARSSLYLLPSPPLRGGGGVIFYNGLHREAPLERGTFFRMEVYKNVDISRAEVLKKVGKTVI